ncbi:Papain family cysteine protease [Tenacibaculum sp. MAR_2009_124]|uniref:C1 family peptidase n=1 Tax=Tenacibaculum sp. MAR_2009_124 TaxID=1250059 RepID=UPI00089A216D|nr:C1 family peptidase [Tenacibaculum sp. MAR_2009_124]SEC52114.1 Papain family cysteine protease [Tenacibaculum sp. MAR_2009_124]
MKNTLTFIAFLFSYFAFGQLDKPPHEISLPIASYNLPCEFSWKKVYTTYGTRNFTTPQRNQPFQGPCLSFAFNAAIETMYKIEFNTSSQILLSDAYTDMKVFVGEMPAFKTVLESGFRIPKRSPFQSIYLPNVNSWLSTKYNGFRMKALNCINVDRNFRVEPIDTDPGQYEILDACGTSIHEQDNLAALEVIPINQLNSVDQLKNIILTKGPVVIKVNNVASESGFTLQEFKTYSNSDVSPLSYHAYLMIGWKNGQGNTTEWIFKDSWPIASGKQLNNTKFLNLLSSGTIELSRVEHILKNGATSQVDDFTVNASLQCVAPQETLELFSIGTLLHHAWIGPHLYSKVFVHSNIQADEWEWNISNVYMTSPTNTSTMSSVLISPTSSGLVTIKVRARKGGYWTPWKQKVIHISNGSGGMH